MKVSGSKYVFVGKILRKRLQNIIKIEFKIKKYIISKVLYVKKKMLSVYIFTHMYVRTHVML